MLKVKVISPLKVYKKRFSIKENKKGNYSSSTFQIDLIEADVVFF